MYVALLNYAHVSIAYRKVSFFLCSYPLYCSEARTRRHRLEQDFAF